MLESTSILTHSLINNNEKDHPRVHAKKLDKVLGYKIPKIEVKLLQKYRSYDRFNDDSNRKQHYKGTQTWIGLHPQILQTPYCDIYEAILSIENFEIKHVVDIGAGYGRVGIVLSVIKPEAKFTGYEILKQRQLEGNRVYEKLGLRNSDIELENVLDRNFNLPEADIYFIYDFSDEEDVFQILEVLSRRIKEKKFYLIARGERVDFLMKHQFKNTWEVYKNLGSSELIIYTSKDV